MLAVVPKSLPGNLETGFEDTLGLGGALAPSGRRPVSVGMGPSLVPEECAAHGV